MHFASIRLNLFCLLQSGPRHFAALFGVIKASPIQVEVRFAHEAVGAQKFRIAPHGFLQKADSLQQASFCVRIVRQVIQLAGSQIKIVSERVGRCRLLNPGFFVRRQMGL